MKYHYTRKQLAELEAEGEREHQYEGKTFCYKPRSDVLVFELVNGVRVEIPRRAVRELASLPLATMRKWRLNRFGSAIEIRELDMDLSVTGLVRDLVGANWQSLGGKARSPAKAAASRRNGRKGGRPRKEAARRKAA